MSATAVLPAVRRIVTGHREDGLAVVHSDITIPSVDVSTRSQAEQTSHSVHSIARDGPARCKGRGDLEDRISTHNR